MTAIARSRSLKVNDFGRSIESPFNFLSANDINLCHGSNRFGIIATYLFKLSLLTRAASVEVFLFAMNFCTVTRGQTDRITIATAYI